MRGFKLFAGVAGVILPGRALAHAAEGGFVLLLPTDLYIAGGVAAVAATVALMALLPARYAEAPFQAFGFVSLPRLRLRHATSLLSAALVLFLVWVGLNGPRDPLVNLLPLAVWTIWWIGMVALQGLVGDHWRFTNPWTGPAALGRWLAGRGALLRYPRQLGHLPAILTYLGFAAVLLADPAPADPARLARYVGLYWLATLAATLVFGPAWLVRAEGLSVLMRAYARTGMLGRRGRRLALGLPGWQILTKPRPAPALAVFILIMLGTGSFDGLNETWWWFGQIGINPLEFPGRTFVTWQNLSGLVVANTALVLVFAATIWIGLKLAKSDTGLINAFTLFAPSILPIALGYHIAHYLTAFLVEAQYALAALTDPLARGMDYLGLGEFYVTTGFFNTQGSVRVIFLAQAGAVVAGHVLAILLAHALAVRVFGSTRRAALSQAPLALFMIFYTLFGLWLLASPRGV